MGKIISRLIPIEDMQELKEKSCLEVQGDTSDGRDGSWDKTIGYDGGIGFREKAIWQFYTHIEQLAGSNAQKESHID